MHRFLQLLVLEYQEDLLATTFVVTASDVVGLLEIRIDQLSSELGDGLHEVELQRVLVPVFDLQFWPCHVDVNPSLLKILNKQLEETFLK